MSDSACTDDHACCQRNSATAPRPGSLVIIGSGAAAVAAALQAAEAGSEVTLIERGRLGGTCVNVGCIPSKALIRAAEALHRARATPFAGLQVDGRLADFATLARQQAALVEHVQRSKYVEVLAAHPRIRIRQGTARFSGPRRLDIDGTPLDFERCIVATGSAPQWPDLPGLAEAQPLDSSAALALTSLPRSLVILGGRIIALELGQAFARLGVKVTILQRSPRLMPELDVDAAETLTDCLRREGLIIHTGVTCRRITGGPGATQVEATAADGTPLTLDTERLLCALGRRPQTGTLGAAAAGIDLGADGRILVDDHLATSNPAVYAAGDVIGDPALVYAAAYEGRLAAANALGERRIRDERVMPWVLFTDPQVAVVGLGEDAARAQGIPVAVARVALDQIPRAIVARDTRGFLKLIKERTGDRLLGAVFVAPEAGDLIMEPSLAIRHGLSVQHLIDAFHPYLTHAEGVRLAAQAFTTNLAQRSCCA